MDEFQVNIHFTIISIFAQIDIVFNNFTQVAMFILESSELNHL